MATTFGNGAYPARNRWQDWANLALAVWLFVSPWVLQFGDAHPAGTGGQAGDAAWNAWVLGVLVFLVALSAVSRMEGWQEWISLLFGAWIFAAPWALGFTHLPAASWDHWITGAVIFLLALSSLGAPAETTVAPPRNPPL